LTWRWIHLDARLLGWLLGNGGWILLGLAFAVVIERLRPARRYESYWPRQFFRDAGAFAVVSLWSKVLGPLVGWANAQLGFLRPGLWEGRLPLAVKIAAVLLVSDFLEYWLHRGMHSYARGVRLLWRTHRWHHEPRALTALAGYRGSAIQRLLFAACYLVCVVAFNLHEPLGIAILTCINEGHQIYAHANIDLELGPLSWLIATPRWHRVHHARDGRLQGSNFGQHFTFWDRLFGTFTPPAQAQGDFPLGIDETAPPSRIRVSVGV
jgi:sterol desaturase/sphingolipid hydroxylase (fatty acid hydroxylase superfamily)